MIPEYGISEQGRRTVSHEHTFMDIRVVFLAVA